MKAKNVDDLTPLQTEGRTSKGNQPKWKDGQFWYKGDYMGYESLSEVVISKLLQKSNLTDFVRYDIVTILRKNLTIIGCESKHFRHEHEQFLPLERLHRLSYGIGLAAKLANILDVKEKIRYTVDFVQTATNIADFGEYLTSILEIDALFLNEDRHTNNIGLLHNINANTFRLSPIYDNGLALLSDTYCYPPNQDIYNLMSVVLAKPFSENFEKQMFAAEELFGIQFKPTFSKKDVDEALKELIGAYQDNILERVRTILYEQMRKYEYMFNI